jgi:transcription antitermination factor NusG
LVAGTKVEVRAGPFRGLQGVVDSRLKQNRLLLQVEMLSRAVSVEIDAALLDPIGQMVLN